MEETVETLAEQHIQLERACVIEKVKEKKKSVIVESPTIKLFVDNDSAERESDDDDLFEDAMSDFPDAFPDHTSPTRKFLDKENLSAYRDYEDSLNDDSSVASAELSLHELKQEGDIKRCASEQALSLPKESGHRRWLSEDIRGGDFAQVSNIFNLLLLLFKHLFKIKWNYQQVKPSPRY